MPLIIAPNTPQTAVVNNPICFDGSGAVVLRGDLDYQPLDLPSSGPNWSYVNQTFRKISGVAGPTEVITESGVPSVQPFQYRVFNTTFVTPPPPDRNQHGWMAVVTDDGSYYGIYILKYCGSNPSCTQNSEPGAQWLMQFFHYDAPTSTLSFPFNPFPVNFREKFHIDSNGQQLSFYGVSPLYTWVIEMPTTTTFRFMVGQYFVGNEFSFVSLKKGSYTGSVPITWSASGGTLSGTSARQCFTSDTPGEYSICLDSEFDEPVCVDITVDDLTFNPVGLGCGQCVFVNDTIHFESNGGLDGVLTVTNGSDPVGTVIDALTWQAPNTPMVVTATYTLGSYSVSCALNVVEEFKVTNVEGTSIIGLVPGDTFQLTTNVEGRTVVWSNIDCDNLVSPTGLITIPSSYTNSCFGAVDCYIRGTVTDFGDTECDNYDDGQIYIDLRIVVNPVYPTPDFGGPSWTKWKPETPDFRVITKTMEGGCAETHIRNRVPIMRWTVNYSGLQYQDENPCIVSCCDDTQGFVNGFDPKNQVAKLLDDFWMLTAGEHGTFTLVDPKTGYVWNNVRFESKLERDHINWRRIQSRTFYLIWNPCCATTPKGGICPHNTIIRDDIAPLAPASIGATAISYSRIDVTWAEALDNIGIHHYELSVNGIIRDVGNVTLYHNVGLPQLSTFVYKVRAFDFDNNPSPWSAETSATTLAALSGQQVYDGADIVLDGTDHVIEG